MKEALPAMIRVSTQIQPTLREGQRATIDGKTGIIQQAGAFSVILKDDQGKTIVIPSKNIINKDIIIESGPSPQIRARSRRK